MKKYWWILLIIAVITLIILAVIFWPRSKTTSTMSSTEISNSTATTSGGSTVPKLIIGDPNAPVTIIEYGDFKCPICNRFFRETEPQIRKQYIDSGKVKLEFHTLPIIAVDSKTAAQGAYCAAEQNKFPQYYDATFNYIYSNFYSKSLKDEFNDILTIDVLTQIAAQQGINEQVFRDCLSTGKYSSAVEADMASAEKVGASATPTFIIGTQKIAGAQPFSVFSPLIDEQLK